MSGRTHWRNLARKKVEQHVDDPDHVPGGVRWNAKQTRALVRFRGPCDKPSDMTPAEARELASTRPGWHKRSES